MAALGDDGRALGVRVSALDAALRAARVAVRQVRGALVPLGAAAREIRHEARRGRALQALAAVGAHLDAIERELGEVGS